MDVSDDSGNDSGHGSDNNGEESSEEFHVDKVLGKQFTVNGVST